MKRIAVIAVLLGLAATAFAAESPSRDPLFKFYGFVKFEASYATAALDNPNSPSFVSNSAIQAKDDNLSMTARYSRIGMDVVMPEFEKIRVSGKFEMDFMQGTTETSGYFRMRLANIDIAFDGGFSIKAGQCWDLIMPLAPTTLNSQAGGGQGSPGIRHPQIQFGQAFDFGLDVRVGAIRIEGSENEVLPAWEGRVAYTKDFLKTKKNPFSLGLSGLYGKLAGDDESYLFGADLVLPLMPELRLKAEAFMAKNAKAYSASIGQKTGKSIGGWAVVEYDMTSKVSLWAGGMTEIMDSDSIATGGKKDNLQLMIGASYALTPTTKVALEAAYLETEYLNQGIANAIRGQLVFQLTF